MDDRTYSDCELRYIDQGFDPSRAAEECGSEGGYSDDEKRKSSEDEGFDEFEGDL